MQIDTAESLKEALHTSGLFDSEQLLAVIDDLTAHKGDFQSLLRYLVQKKHLTVYQLRKVIHGKTHELLMGPYVISDRIGEGGMGKVYRATQMRLGREVALKVVRTSLLNNPLVRKRYNREVETASSLNHPNIVGVYDAGEVEGKYYLAMEFVDGIDLSRLVREYRPLEVVEVCEYIRQAALGLQYAHDQGLVHRDIKPSNIVVAGERHLPQATEPAVVKILDMGLVRSVGFDEDGGGGGGDLTRAGTVVGTPDYMAPEQAKNSSGVDCRADLYSLGCTLYYLLSGQPPFPTGTPIEKLLKHQLDAPIPLQALRPSVPTPVAELISRLIAKDPNQRIQSALEVARIISPLARYAEGTLPVSIYSREDELTQVVTLPPSGLSTFPPAPIADSTIRPGLTEPQPLSAAQPVAPSDHTPRPRDLPSALQTVGESASPFSSLSDPSPGPQKNVPPTEETTALPPPSRNPLLWIAISILAVSVFAGIGIWLAFGNRDKDEDPATSAPGSPGQHEGTVKPPSRPGLVPVVNQSRLHPWQDLVANDAGLVAIGYPATYLREVDSPYNSGTGPGKLSGWVDRFTSQTSLQLSRSNRVVFSSPGSLDKYQLVSEGDYLTPSFANVLAKNVNLNPLRNPGKLSSSLKLFQAQSGRQTALIPLASGGQVYAISSVPQLLQSLTSRLSPIDRAPPQPRIDSGMAAELNSANNHTPPLMMVALGPSFQFPFAFQSLDKDILTLQDLELDLVAAQVRIHERMQIEIVLLGKNEKSVGEFLVWVKKKISDEYPRDGVAILNLLSKAEQAGESANGKYRLTLKITWTPEQWSSFLDRLFAP
jgi:serine/threonine-protein kinase